MIRVIRTVRLRGVGIVRQDFPQSALQNWQRREQEEVVTADQVLLQMVSEHLEIFKAHERLGIYWLNLLY